eukprot:1572382-Prymnesium_polylepis.1
MASVAQWYCTRRVDTRMWNLSSGPIAARTARTFTRKAPVLMLYGFCFFSTRGTLSDLLEARAGMPHPRTDPARLPHDAQQRPQYPYTSSDSNLLIH